MVAIYENKFALVAGYRVFYKNQKHETASVVMSEVMLNVFLLVDE